jgi:Asp-tRNA(Asn)/Glu-tRNA(Gln) amidotransferase A subunit family amidase
MADLTRREVLAIGAGLVAGAAAGGEGSAVPGSRIAEYDRLDATAMAELVRKGDVTAGELLEEAIARTDAWNPRLHAVVIRHDDLARRAAQGRLEGPLAGVPFLIKDLNTYLAGTVTSEGCRFFADAVAVRDSFVVDRYRGAGLVLFGKTASPELGKSPATESLLWGDTRNPWNTAYIPGGSSGGSAAAVAAGIVPAAHGSDGGGSIRLPASACGLFGLKPSRFRVPLGPGKGDGGGLSTVHALTRSVRDSALLLDVSQGPEPGGYGSIGAPERPYVEEVGRSPGALRIGLLRKPSFDAPVHPECAKAADHAARLCEGLGHRVEEVTLPIDGVAAYAAAGLILSLGSTVAIRNREKALGRAVTPQDVEPITWTRMQQYANTRAEELAHARNLQVEVHLQLAEFMQRHDVILSPTLPVLPARVGELGPRRPIADFDREASAYGLFTMLFNFTGQPAMSVPLHWTPDGLPVGVHFAGRYGEEALLLRLAGQLEQASPWFGRRPALPG